MSQVSYSHGEEKLRKEIKSLMEQLNKFEAEDFEEVEVKEKKWLERRLNELRVLVNAQEHENESESDLADMKRKFEDEERRLRYERDSAEAQRLINTCVSNINSMLNDM